MSGIYIKAFKAPMSCWECHCRGLKALVGCTVCLTYSNRDDMGIASANCKIISVPDHGRLGDLDALLEIEAQHWITEYDSEGYEADEMGAYTMAQIDAMPTIIPADKGVRE